MFDRESGFFPDLKEEMSKRKREIFTVLFLLILFLFLTWLEIRLFSVSQQLPFIHSIFFFGLVNFNIIILLFLLYLIFRNVVKSFVEKKGKVFGSSLKAKLILAFVGFSSIPTLLIFLTSVFYINSSFDKWFSVKMASVLRSSLEVTNAYYFNAKKKNYHFAHQIAQSIADRSSRESPEKIVQASGRAFALDSVEYFESVFADRVIYLTEDENLPEVPVPSLDFLQKGLKAKVDASTIHQFGDGNLVRVIVPLPGQKKQGAVVVSSFVPLSLISKMNDISSAYEEFRDINPLEYPLKSIYLTILILMTAVILLGATWFGFYLAKQLSVPLVQLGRATRRITTGNFSPVEIRSGSEEISDLVHNFNQMTVNLENSQQSLRQTLEDLNHYAKYIEVVLKNVNTGVLSVDPKGMITTMNRRAGDLLKVDPYQMVGRSVRELLTIESFRSIADLLRTMQDEKLQTLSKEINVLIQEESLPLMMTLSILKNEQDQEIGKILVFDDMTPIVSAQRAAAWTEVARRMAHEIKNPLTPIRLSAERLQRKFGDQIQDEAFKSCTHMIIQQTEDLKNLVNEFSQFARLPQSKPQLGSFHDLLLESSQVFQTSHPQVQLSLEFSQEETPFKFDPAQLKRVMMNLLDNAAAATKGEPQPRIVVQTIYDLSAKVLRLTVSDNGIGIPAENRSRVFEPYMTTKADGTGLGLAIVKRIIEDHGGLIRALPNPPRGTKILIELPLGI